MRSDPTVDAHIKNQVYGHIGNMLCDDYSHNYMKLDRRLQKL